MDQKLGQQSTSITIKIQHKKAIFNLGKSIFSYKDLVEGIQARFSDVKTINVYFQEDKVTENNFISLIKQQISKGDKSIKLQFRQAQITQNKIVKNSRTKKYSFNPSQFDNQAQKLTKRYQPLKQNKQEQQCVRQAQQCARQNECKPDNINIKVLIQNGSTNIKIQQGTQYKWCCILVNKSQDQVPKQVYIRDLTSHRMIELKGLGINEAKEICFGPYIQEQAGRHTHFYQILFKKNEQILKPIGSKFGFVCDVVKKVPIKQLKNRLFQRVNKLRNFTECQKSAQYIVRKLNQIGIEEAAIDQYNDQDLIDIIESLNKE